jgi:hypothetical protein
MQIELKIFVRRREMREIRFIVMMAVFVFFGGAYQAEGVYDHFNDGVLDSAWQVSYENATGWTYQESGTNIKVTNVAGSGSDWHHAYIKQNFAAAGDFSLNCAISWDSIHGYSDIQTLGIHLYSSGRSAINAGYHDAWVGEGGEKGTTIEGSVYGTGMNTLPFAGNALIEIERENGFVTVSWDGGVLLTGTSSSIIDQVGIEFCRNGYDFSSLSVDYVSAVPEPGTILLLGLGSMILAGRRRKV